MKSNEKLQNDVQEAITWEPILDAAEIGVTAKNGVITLSGTVNSYSKKRSAEIAAKQIFGVKAVVGNILVHLECSSNKLDSEIAVEVLNTLTQCWEIKPADIQVKVADGWVTLFGTQQWNFQRLVAINSISKLSCVTGVTNNIELQTKNEFVISQPDIEKALERNWTINNSRITIGVDGNKVTLYGNVNSLYQKEEAERITWGGKGVCFVENKLLVTLHV